MTKRNLTSSEQIAFSVTRWVGSTQSIAVHTLAFASAFAAVWFGLWSFNEMLLGLTTVVSLEAIYLAIFIQMTVNRTTQSLEEVEEDIDEMQEDVEEIQKDVDELQEDIEEISEEDKKEAMRDKEQEGNLEAIREKLTKLALELEKFADKHAGR